MSKKTKETSKASAVESKPLLRIQMPQIGTGVVDDTLRPKYGGPGYHFRINPVVGGETCICTEIPGIPIPEDILNEPDVFVLDAAGNPIPKEEPAEEAETSEETPAEETTEEPEAPAEAGE